MLKQIAAVSLPLVATNKQSILSADGADPQDPLHCVVVHPQPAVFWRTVPSYLAVAKVRRSGEYATWLIRSSCPVNVVSEHL
jgi:hypothetical protein